MSCIRALYMWRLANPLKGNQMQANTRAIVRRYAFTIGAIGFAVAIALLLSMWRGVTVPLIVLFVAVVVSVAKGGLGQGIVAAILGSAINVVWVYVSHSHFEPDDIFELVVFIVASVLACGMIPHWRTILTGKPAAEPNLNLLSTAIATAGEAVAVLSDDGGIVSANPTFAKLIGQADWTLVARSILDVVSPPDRPMVAEALQRSRETGGDELEARILWRDAAPADANLIFVRYNTPDGSCTGHYCFLRTLSRRKREEAKAPETRDRFRDAFQYSPIGIAIIATDGRLLEVNRALCVITGYMEDELKVQDLQSITHPDDLKTDMEMLHRLRSGEINHYSLKKRYVGQRGEAIPVLVSVTMVRDNRAKPLYYIAQAQAMGAPDTQTIIPMDAPAPSARNA